MGSFICQHKWGKWGKPYLKNGHPLRQRKCSLCGRMKVKRISQAWCMHRWRLDRRLKKPTLRCRKCLRTKTLGRNDDNGSVL